jgi:hydrogenase maturation protease
MTGQPTVAPILITGCGNADAADDGFGLQVVRRLAQHPVEGVELLELGSRPAFLLDHLQERAGLIVIDAAMAAGIPTGRIFDEDWYGPVRQDLLAEKSCSTHGLGIVTQLALAQTLGLLPVRTRLLGITIDDATFGHGPSDESCGRITDVAGLAVRHAVAWLAAPGEASDA